MCYGNKIRKFLRNQRGFLVPQARDRK
jgi:hypothetical protein